MQGSHLWDPNFSWVCLGLVGLRYMLKYEGVVQLHAEAPVVKDRIAEGSEVIGNLRSPNERELLGILGSPREHFPEP